MFHKTLPADSVWSKKKFDNIFWPNGIWRRYDAIWTLWRRHESIITYSSKYADVSKKIDRMV